MLPVLLKVGGKAGTLPAAARTAVNTLKNLAIDALEVRAKEQVLVRQGHESV